jgi:hypothetical protein
MDDAPMTRDPRPRASAILTSPAFVLAVALLLVNDWMLKPALGGPWTGKLSDAAGVFAFPLFWSAFWPGRRPAIYAATAAAFLVWKSPLSGAPLAAWNALGFWPLARVVDYTDWLALAALVPSYRAAGRAAGQAPLGWARLARRAGAAASAAVALVAFAASSRVHPTYHFEPQPGYPVGAYMNDIRATLGALGFELRARARHESMADTFALTIGRTLPRPVLVAVELRDGKTCGTVVTPLSASVGGDRPDLSATRELFVREVIQPLRTRFPGC